MLLQVETVEDDTDSNGNQSRIANYANVQKSKNPESNFSKTWKGRRRNMQGVIIIIGSLLQCNIIIKSVVHLFNFKVYILKLCGMNMMGGSVKSNSRGFKILCL